VATNRARKNSDNPLSRANRFTAALVSSLREPDQDAGSAAGGDDHEIGEKDPSHAEVRYPCLTFDKRRQARALHDEGRWQSHLLRRREGCYPLLGRPRPSRDLPPIASGVMFAPAAWLGTTRPLARCPVRQGRLRQSPVERPPPSLPGFAHSGVAPTAARQETANLGSTTSVQMPHIRNAASDSQRRGGARGEREMKRALLLALVVVARDEIRHQPEQAECVRQVRFENREGEIGRAGRGGRRRKGPRRPEPAPRRKCRTAGNAAKIGAGKPWCNLGACVKAPKKTS
jgi:hypothetical protein